MQVSTMVRPAQATTVRFGQGDAQAEQTQTNLNKLFKQFDAELKQNEINKANALALRDKVYVIVRGRNDYDLPKVQEMKTFLKQQAGATDHPTKRDWLEVNGTAVFVEHEVLRRTC